MSLIAPECHGKICNEFSPKLSMEEAEMPYDHHLVMRPDLACCDISAVEDQCSFTSHCNRFGVCCSDPGRYEKYL